ncbi:carboxymethylenebutenolidase [Friedmanniella luteola]|uniref:Carboxymethylenebutenolidase n=1 Tax=Friedmanniella luteola TaxID=546871 RepID=A0A1H1QH71_9ACTN|nr:dienelactone hydrolase family protein [Friedmanniella luteola]SDS22663.1 carboxymethylenebutenolidase [Friedmanniella luteola]
MTADTPLAPLQDAEVPTADGPMPALVVRPPSGSGPGLVLVQEIFGVTGYIRQRAADLAALGYLVVVPEVYWRLPDHTLPEAADDLLPRAMALVQQLDWPAAVQDVATAVRFTRDLDGVDGRVGLVGFCFGGGLAFNVAAVEPVEALVSYYGSALGDLLALAEQVRTPSLHHFGTDDAYVPPSTQDAIRRAVTPTGARFVSHPGAGHAFDNPAPAFHHAEASREAWAVTAAFLAEHLPPRAAGESSAVRTPAGPGQ